MPDDQLSMFHRARLAAVEGHLVALGARRVLQARRDQARLSFDLWETADGRPFVLLIKWLPDYRDLRGWSVFIPPPALTSTDRRTASALLDDLAAWVEGGNDAQS